MWDQLHSAELYDHTDDTGAWTDPDRFEKGRAKQLPKYAYFPFGGGPRVCIGNHFAMMEAILILAIVMQRHHFELLPDQPLDLAPSVTLRPAKGVRAVVKHRPGRPRVAEAAESLSNCTVIMLAQFSMASAAKIVESRVSCPVLTSPDSAVRRLKG